MTGETDRPRKRRSMEGRRGFRRLTGQKAEPPWGVKLTLLGSGQDGWRRDSSWQEDLEVQRMRVIKPITNRVSGADMSGFLTIMVPTPKASDVNVQVKIQI